MTKWDYRVVIKDGVYAIHECYYNEKGAPHSISTDEMCPAGETFEDLRMSYGLMAEAFEKPALRYEDFGGGDQPPLPASTNSTRGFLKGGGNG